MSTTDERQTPVDLFVALNREFFFTCDVAASSANALCDDFYSLERSAFDHDWPIAGTAWCNPPYSRGQILRWVKRAEEMAHRNGCLTVMLLPGDSSTQYYRHIVMANHEMRVLNSRWHFEGAPLTKTGKKAPARFPNIIVIVRPEHPLWYRLR